MSTPDQVARRTNLLRSAKRYVDDVRQDLNDESTPCQTCGRNFFDDLDEARMKPMLASVVAKLGRVINWMESGKMPPSEE